MSESLLRLSNGANERRRSEIAGRLTKSLVASESRRVARSDRVAGDDLGRVRRPERDEPRDAGQLEGGPDSRGAYSVRSGEAASPGFLEIASAALHAPKYQGARSGNAVDGFSRSSRWKSMAGISAEHGRHGDAAAGPADLRDSVTMVVSPPPCA